LFKGEGDVGSALKIEDNAFYRT